MDLSAPGIPFLSRASQVVLKLSRPAKRLIMLGADARHAAGRAVVRPRSEV